MFVKGYQNFDGEAQKVRMAAVREQKKMRMFAGKNQTVIFCFVDDPEIGVVEHQCTFAGQNNFNNFYTCLGEGHCPLCNSGHRPHFCSLYTVFDLKEWTNREGKKGHFTRRLYTPKGSELEQLKKLRADFGGSLKGAVLQLHKGGGQRDRAQLSPYIRNGSIMKLSEQDIAAMVIRDGYKPEQLAVPYDYQALFAPDHIQVLRSVVPRILSGKEKQQEQQQGQFPSYGGQGVFDGQQPQYGNGGQGFQGQPSYPQQTQSFPAGPAAQGFSSPWQQPSGNFPSPQGQNPGFAPQSPQYAQPQGVPQSGGFPAQAPQQQQYPQNPGYSQNPGFNPPGGVPLHQPPPADDPHGDLSQIPF